MKDEGRRRTALAQSAYVAGKRLLYENSTIPLDVRAGLFHATILPTYFNLGLWIPTGDEWQKLCHGYLRQLRNLFEAPDGGPELLQGPSPVGVSDDRMLVPRARGGQGVKFGRWDCV